MEGVYQIDSKTKEDVVVDEDLLLRLLIRIQRHHIPVDYRAGSLNSCIQKVVVDFDDRTISLEALH